LDISTVLKIEKKYHVVAIAEEEEEEEELVKKTEMVEFNSHPPDHKSNVFKFMNPDEKGESIAAKLVRRKQG